MKFIFQEEQLNIVVTSTASACMHNEKSYVYISNTFNIFFKFVIKFINLSWVCNQAVDSGGNAAKAGLKAGDQVLYTSSFFGDELWPADKLGFTKTAIQAKPDSVYFVVSRLNATNLLMLFNCSIDAKSCA